MSRPLREEIKQPKAFRSLEEETFLNILRTSAALVGSFVEMLRPHGITQPQYNVLRILRGAGEAGLPSQEVGVRMVSREPDVTRLLDRMERNGLVTRERESADRRVVTTRLSEQGRTLVDALDEPVRQLLIRCLGHLAPEELTSLTALLERARETGHPPDA